MGAITEPFGAMLHRLRQRAGLTQEQLAERAKLSVKAISALERGERRYPYRPTVRALATALQLSTEERTTLEVAVPRRNQRLPGRALKDLPRARSEVTSSGQVWNVPARSPLFIGREDLLEELRKSLRSGGTTVVRALHGMGGIGKTALTIEYAHRYGVNYDVVWWIPAEQPALVAHRLAELAHALGAAAITDPVTVAVARLWGMLREQDRWLLIFDNAEDPAALAVYLPGGGGHVVITSRNPDWQELGIPVGVGVFSRSESIALLRRRAPRLTEGEAGQIAQVLGDLPLTLTQAGAHLADTISSVEDYLTLLAERTTELLAHEVSATYPVSLTASVQIALDRLAAQCPAALQLLTLAAYLAPEPIPWTLFTLHPAPLPEPLGTVAADPLAFSALIRLIRQYGLAGVEPPTLIVHRLLAAILRTQPHSSQDRATQVVRVLRAAVPADNPRHNPSVWPVWRPLLPHVLVATDPRRTLTGVEEDVAWLLHYAAEYLWTQTETALARPLVERARDLRRSLWGEDHPDTLESASVFASVLWQSGHYERAHRVSEDTLTRCRQILGNDHPLTLFSAVVLAGVLWGLGQHQQARKLSEDTLTRCRQILGNDHSITLLAAAVLAGALWTLVQHEQARKLSEDTLIRCRQVLDNDNPLTLCSAAILAGALWALGQHEQARELGEDTLIRCHRVLGNDHVLTLIAAAVLAGVLWTLGQHEQAREHSEDTLTRCQVLGNDHPATLLSAAVLASVLEPLGQHEQPRELSQDTLTRCRQVLGNDHFTTLRSVRSLAAVLASLRERDQARQREE
ncbi:MAG: FxSxx-COOH system tetratricopeptide repeat protein [Pseudonocardiaceae bacterium]